MIEPFAGSAALSLAAAHAGKATGFVLGDANEPLIDLWDMILRQPEQLAARYRHHWLAQKGQEREYYNAVQDWFNETPKPEYFLYLLARCVKAFVRYNAWGEFNQGPDNRRCGTHPETMRHHILAASRLLSGRTTLLRGDYGLALAQANPDDIVYMDPPYQGVCGRRNPRYSTHLDYDAFVAALSLLNARGISYLVSYDGRTGEQQYGKPLPPFLQLMHNEISAGRSTQATLLGRTENMYETLYLSPTLAFPCRAVQYQSPPSRCPLFSNDA